MEDENKNTNKDKSIEEQFFSMADEEIGHELLSLPAPPKEKKKHPLLLSLIIIMGAVMIYWLRTDFSYFFVSSKPVKVGDVVELNLKDVKSNSYVYITGFPNPTKVVKFSKRFHRGYFRIFPLVGKRGVFVQMHFTEDKQQKKKTSELPREFIGRAIRFREIEKTGILSSSYKHIRNFYFEKFLIEIPDEALLIMDGEEPRSYWMYPLIVFILFGFIIFNTISLIRYASSKLQSKKK